MPGNRTTTSTTRGSGGGGSRPSTSTGTSGGSQQNTQTRGTNPNVNPVTWNGAPVPVQTVVSPVANNRPTVSPGSRTGTGGNAPDNQTPTGQYQNPNIGAIGGRDNPGIGNIGNTIIANATSGGGGVSVTGGGGGAVSDAGGVPVAPGGDAGVGVGGDAGAVNEAPAPSVGPSVPSVPPTTFYAPPAYMARPYFQLPEAFLAYLSPSQQRTLDETLQTIGFDPMGQVTRYGESGYLLRTDQVNPNFDAITDPSLRQWLRFFYGQFGRGISYQLPADYGGTGLPTPPPDSGYTPANGLPQPGGLNTSYSQDDIIRRNINPNAAPIGSQPYGQPRPTAAPARPSVEGLPYARVTPTRPTGVEGLPYERVAVR